MPADNVSALRTLFEDWNRGEIAATASALDEFVVWDARESLVPDLRGVYVGLAGVRDFWKQWLPMWERVSVEIQWIEGDGDRVKTWVHQTHIGHESGVELGWEYGWDVTFRDCKIIRVSFFTNEEDGRRGGPGSRLA